MTVEELIRILQKFPGGQRVVVDGYEGGCDEIGPINNARILAFENTKLQDSWGGGKDASAAFGAGVHEIVTDDVRAETVIYIKRKRQDS
jgi:hypothetical protein